MSSKSYKINKWEGLVTPYSTKLQPVVYIEPDTGLLNYAHINGNKCRIKITNSLSLYDNISMIGYFTKPKECCDDSTECNSSYIFILDTDWKGVPLSLGTIDVYNDDTRTTSTQVPLRMLPPSSTTPPKKYTWILWTIVALLILISIIIFILYMYENTGSNIKPIEQPQSLIKNTYVQTPSTNTVRDIQPHSTNTVEIQSDIQPPSTNTVEIQSDIDQFFVKTGLSNEILKNRLIERGKTNFTSN